MKTQSGRSMIEMLGVLAIIGVLSAGALAGYSKAMYQHKLNIQKTAFDTLLLNAISLSNRLDDVALHGCPILHNLNQIPTGLTYENGEIYDQFQNKLHVYYASSQATAGYRAGISVNIKNTNDNVRACANMIKSAQEISSEIWMLERSTGQDEEGSNTGYAGHLWGDQYCAPSNRICLKDLTMNDILALCKNDSPQGVSDEYTLYILWNPITN